jgi:LPXTG-motif cell wall-anchored protein
MRRLGPLAAILACCGVKLIVLAAVLIPSGFLTQNLWVAAVGIALAVVLVVVAVRRRRYCSGACHVPATGRIEERPGTGSVSDRDLQ